MSVFYFEPFFDLNNLCGWLFGRTTPYRQQQTNERTPYVNDKTGPRMADLHQDSARPDVFTATFELPGTRRKVVEISVQNGALVITAKLKARCAEVNGHIGTLAHSYTPSGGGSTSLDDGRSAVQVHETHLNQWTRAFRLPTGLTNDPISASMTGSVLTITFTR
ncbi:hypothetical protein FISHEDRAFT_78059 [Fistulina hepatica ATCC 64428]|nr:hypothetical protein FISHEDRAFT_78059 [Fistulina hepatica ATCC 64428]